MIKIKLIIFLLLFHFFSYNYSQGDSFSCGTVMPQNYLEIESNSKSDFNYYINEFYNKTQLNTSTALTDIPVKIHVVRNDFGLTNINVDEILSEIGEVNSFLQNSFLRINICDEINYINDSSLYEFDLQQIESLYSNHQENILNI